jgi:hypothetical protein
MHQEGGKRGRVLVLIACIGLGCNGGFDSLRPGAAVGAPCSIGTDCQIQATCSNEGACAKITEVGDSPAGCSDDRDCPDGALCGRAQGICYDPLVIEGQPCSDSTDCIAEHYCNHNSVCASAPDHGGNPCLDDTDCSTSTGQTCQDQTCG